MSAPAGLRDSLNAIREMSVKNNSVYHQYVPIITDTTDIGTFATPILSMPEVQNEFVKALVDRIAYTSFEMKRFRNPLKMLEGDAIPLGRIGQEIYVNPAKGRRFNGEDFAGILKKYSADVKVQYQELNMDLQYPVSISRNQLRTAMVSWEDLNMFIDQLSNSLYNGAFIGEYQYTKNIIAGAYKDNRAIIERVSSVSTEAAAKDFITKARTLYLNFQAPSTKYNAWHKMGGEGRPVTTWTNPEDIIFVIRNDIRSFLDVNVMASSFNISSAELLGRIVSVDNFDAYDDDGTLIFDGSNIVGMIADRKWFRIKKQDMFLETDYNPNNRTYQYYLNLIKMYNYSLFANGVIFATELPEIAITGLDYEVDSITIEEVGDQEGLDIKVTPVNGTTSIVYTSDDEDVFTVVADTLDNRHCIITATGEGTATLTATAGDVTETIEVTIPTNV